VVNLDEVTFLTNLLIGHGGTDEGGSSISMTPTTVGGATNSWSQSATDKGLTNHKVTPTIVDIRNLKKNKAMRVDLSSTGDSTTSDLLVVFEEGQTISYPTINWDVRNEEYTLVVHIRTIQDTRASSDTWARDRLESLYKVLRHRLESNRKGATVTVGSNSAKIDQIFMGNRTESNDRSKRIFGYKVNVTLKRFAVTL